MVGDWLTYARKSVEKEMQPVGEGFETRISNQLTKLAIEYVKDPVVLSLNHTFSDGSLMTFKPDYSLPKLTIGGKEILLEPHGSKFFNQNFVFKLKTFMASQYHLNYHLILITDDKYKEYVQTNINNLGATTRNIADEFWMLRSTDSVAENLIALKARAKSTL